MRATLCALLATSLPVVALAQQMPPPSVTVQPAVVGEYTLTTRLPGRIKASKVAEVRPQVTGIIREELFEEGSWVEAGQPLYKIDDAVYAAAVAAAKAAVAQAQATYDLSVLDANRAEGLLATNAGSAANRDKATATRDGAAAALQAAQAQLTSAEIDLDHTTVRAPVSGVIGLSQTNTGSLVGAQQVAPLATIRTLDPIYVDVTQSVNDLMRWNTPGTPNEILKSAEAALILPNGETFPHKGQMKAAEPQVEPTTGMVTLRISFDNPDFVLLPGLYVEVVLPQTTEKNTVLVPQSAVMRDVRGGANVWVVEDGKIAVRPVTILGASGNNWVVSSGLNAGDQIVTSGFQKAGPGAEVVIAPPDAAPGQEPAPSEGN
ncbi:efflux RND transporter periplasmic adaptor subunit [Tabrizicola sp. J26]|uniref:efflux RND transporter periplasmic adaptor subunit n=1 Tax=Alitabrizicola rongguiensis TaxID=2909234 RepID=UPI001F406867|nr:efflux RND transporter periplasmic adaptor subunit [Tabrizicola rongguiensis]MCF1709530.1 efflux RND transporter periplasmic adaptor subunit [Tabrizicola rongguiensis]